MNIYRYDSCRSQIPMFQVAWQLAEHICTCYYIEVILPTDSGLFALFAGGHYTDTKSYTGLL